jgi:hypothetical protein
LVDACRSDRGAERRSLATATKRAIPDRVELVAAPADGDVLSIVRTAYVHAAEEGRDILVYVGAKWCEPCVRFHEAALAGALDRTFPTLRLIELDLDRDRERLRHAGYTSKMIPLFVAPRADGTPSDDRLEGSIKGPGAVEHIAERLSPLVSSVRAVRAANGR